MCLERVCGVCEIDVEFGEIDTRDSDSEVDKLSEDERDGSMIGQHSALSLYPPHDLTAQYSCTCT